MEKEEITQCIGRLEGKMDMVIARLDKYNGSVANLFKDVDDLKTYKAEQDGAGKVVGVIAGFVGAIVSSVITAFTIKFFKL